MNSASSSTLRKFELFGFTYGGILICSAVIFALWLWHFVKEKIPEKGFFLIFFSISSLLFLRPSLFFFWDEWHVIERFRTEGFFVSFVGHNEHFIPAFFSFYFLELKFFGSNYFYLLLTSSAIHALNSYLLLNVLRRLSQNFKFSEQISRGLTILFLISALHSEIMHWAFEQCILLSATFTLGAVLSALNYLQTSENRWLRLALLSAALAPFCFANGFLVFLFVPLTIAWEFFHAGRIVSVEMKRLSLCLVVTAFLPIILYILASADAAGHGLGQTSPIDSPRQVAKYLVYGTQLGTIVRGLGLYPGLLYGDSREFFGMALDTPLLNPTINFKDPENLFFYLGVYISLGTLILLIRRYKPGDSAVTLWIFGQAWMAIAFLLLTYGRSSWGYHNSLTLRYQYFAQPGLCIFLLPVLDQLTSIKIRGQLRTIFFFLLIAGHIFSQLWLSGTYYEFTDKGLKNRIWLNNLSIEEEYPPLSLTPSMKASQVKLSYDWLENKNMPLPSVFIWNR